MQLLSRKEFKEQVFARDKVCVVCKGEAKDAHHIIPRKSFKSGGYFVDNGVALCHTCHRLAESKEISAQELRNLAGIKTVVLPTPYEGKNGTRFRDI